MVSIHAFKEEHGRDIPGRIMKYVLFYCTEGRARVVADENELELPAGSVVTITSGQVHYLKDYSGANGFILTFTLDFFCKNDGDIELVFENGLFCHFAMNEVVPIQDNEYFLGLLMRMKEELLLQPYQYLISIHSGIELLLVAINRSKVNRGDEIWKPNALFLKFLELVRSDFGHIKPVSRYAELLGTTDNRLNELARLHTGKTAQNVIYGLLASEAKRLLTYEKLLVKDVAYSLGFSDPFYFSNFFKKHTGQSPKSYQTEKAL